MPFGWANKYDRKEKKSSTIIILWQICREERGLWNDTIDRVGPGEILEIAQEHHLKTLGAQHSTTE
jgi:hypothetical protein